MKKILSTLIVISLSLIAFSSKAQVTDGTDTSVHISKNQTVKQNSYHKYTITPGSNTSKIVWTVSGGTDGKFYSDNNGTEIALPLSDRLTTVYLKWIEPAAPTEYLVTINEKSSLDCTDDKVNTIKIKVTIEDNNFAGTLVWKDHAADVADCAIDGSLGLTFNLSVVGHKENVDCTYKYKIGVSETVDGVVTWDAEQTSDFAPTTTDISTSKVIPRGDGQYYVWIQVTELLDGYNTPVNNLATLITKATINKLPETATITLD